RPAGPAVDDQADEHDLLEGVAGELGVDGDGEQQHRAGQLHRPGPHRPADRQRDGGQCGDVADQVGPADVLAEEGEAGVGPFEPPHAGVRAAHQARPLPAAGSAAAPTAAIRSTYLAMTSTSRLTVPPAAVRPRVVSSRVVGIRLTVKAASSTEATVRLTPSTAIEPFSAT